MSVIFICVCFLMWSLANVNGVAGTVFMLGGALPRPPLARLLPAPWTGGLCSCAQCCCQPSALPGR